MLWDAFLMVCGETFVMRQPRFGNTIDIPDVLSRRGELKERRTINPLPPPPRKRGTKLLGRGEMMFSD